MSKAFISYSHGSIEHCNHVLVFAQALRSHGIDVELDQFHSHEIVDWPRWCNEQLSHENSDFVLCVCTGEYNRRIEGKMPPEKGKGVYWEGSLIDDDLYDKKGNPRFIPILFDDTPEDTIPRILRGWTFCRLRDFAISDSGYEQVIRILTNQASVTKNPLGYVPVLPPKAANSRPTRPLLQPQISPTRIIHGANRLFGREKELESLDLAWDDPKINILTLIAFGGVGKTSLIVEWMNRKAATSWPTMERVFDWSFYNQGTGEEGSVSSDMFIKSALTFFSDKETAGSADSAWDKGARLADLIAERPSLLVLDGLEPLQSPPGQQCGKLKDAAMEALLKGLARRNTGTCLITTRVSVADLRPFCGTTSSEIELQHLSPQAGVDLLTHLGVKGTDSEIRQLVVDVKGHALTLNLMGCFLTEAYQGDIRKRDTVRFYEADEEIHGGHAFRVIEAYERWFAEDTKSGRRLLCTLSLLGLFDRPADSCCLTALRREPAISGLTEKLIDQGKASWGLTLTRLEKCGLVTITGIIADGNYFVDTHPLIREYFAIKLRNQKPIAWRKAHRRLFEYLTKTTMDKSQPTLEDLQPLYQAVVHGCLAEIYETSIQIYQNRILRSREFYSIYKLGAFGADLGAIAYFFESPWSKVSSSLTENNQAWLLATVAFCFRSLGRLSEALESLRAGRDLQVKQKDWQNASIASSNLSELELTLGGVNLALTESEKAIKFADQCNNSFQQIIGRVCQADAWSFMGQLTKALDGFREAESMQCVHQPEFPFLYSVQGFQYCDLILKKAEETAWRTCLVFGFDKVKDISPRTSSFTTDIETSRKLLIEVESRVKQILLFTEKNITTLYDIPIMYLMLGRIALYRILLSDCHDHEVEAMEEARRHLANALGGLRHSPTSLVVEVFLSRAWFHMVQGDNNETWVDLDEAWEIAERGPMQRQMADIYLYRARLFHDKVALRQARAHIERCGYWRRKEELKDAEDAAKNW